MGPLCVGPLCVGPLCVGRLCVGPLCVRPLCVGPFHSWQSKFACSYFRLARTIINENYFIA